MASIKITPDELGRLSYEFSQVSLQIGANIRAVKDLLAQLDSSWSENPAYQLTDKINQQLANTQQLTEGLTALSECLRETQQQYRMAEESIASSIASQFRI